MGRVGRGGAKSHTSSKVALNETLFGDWRVPPGERHFWAFVSARREEAEQRVVLLESFLRALGVPFDTKGGTIVLRDLPRGFKVFACNIGAVSGFRCFGYSADELAKWNVEGVNPAGEVCASLNAMTVTHPGARRLLISSPLGLTDYHATRFDAGDNESQVTAWAPSWVANPTGITEEQTKQTEPDERVRAREYGAIPGSGITDDWFGAGVGMAAVSDVPQWQPWMRVVVAVDQAFAQDRFGWAVCSSVARETGRLTTIHEVGAWKPDRTPGEMAARVKREVCAKYGVGHDDSTRIFCDQHEGFSFRELARRESLWVEVVPWTGGEGETSKATRFRTVRMAMLQGEFRMPDEPNLIKQFRSVRGVILPSGGERIEVQRTVEGHGDAVSALVLAASIALSLPPQPVHVAPIRPGTPEWAALEDERQMAKAEREVMQRNRLEANRRGAVERRIRGMR
ncbi:MAG TPA: hypothetical protein VGK73_06705 [Polyangiaceae bacterium]